MGYASYSADTTRHIASKRMGFAPDDVFTRSKTKTAAPEMEVKELKFRECRDSAAHPNSLGVLVFLDVTGSMGSIPMELVGGTDGTPGKMKQLIETIIKHGTPDGAVCFCAIGDHTNDKYPLQVGQFESGSMELDKCITDTLLERGGGGTDEESYLLAWLVAARHTVLDSLEKRGQKGILFTIGDEKSYESISGKELQALIDGYGQSPTLTDKQLLEEAQRAYEVFHIHINETGYKNNKKVLNYWKDLLGQRLIILDDHTQVGEIIGSTVALLNGANIKDVVSDFDPKIAREVTEALATVNTSRGVSKSQSGVVKL